MVTAMNDRFNHIVPSGAGIAPDCLGAGLHARPRVDAYTVPTSEAGLLSRKNGIALMLGVAAGMALLTVRMSPIPQPASYHTFADQRRWLGISNFWNVISNLPFAIVGVWGIAFILRSGTVDQKKRFLDPRERWPYIAAFSGLVLTAFGSAYYHLAPNNARLVWDRLPMTIVFGSIVAALIAERISVRAGVMLLPWLIAFGAASVLEWYWAELRGHGDLRIYAAVQIYSALALLMALLLPARYTRGFYFAVVFGFYVLAKLFESFDRAIYSAGHLLSGHTLKHLAAAAAGYCILRMLQLREPLTGIHLALTPLH